MESPIFDAHFHIGAAATRSFAGRTITPVPDNVDHADGAACRAYLSHYGLDGGVIIPTYLEDQTSAFRTNHLVLETVDPTRNLYGALWVSPLSENRARTEAALSVLPHTGIRALKMASNTWEGVSVDPRTWTPEIRATMERILATAHTHHLVVHFHTGYLPEADPLHFDAFLSEYGEAATYQLVHMGEAIAPAFRFVPRFIEWIEKGYDVYTDTSIVPGFAPRWLVGELLARGLGVDRVLFATDSPWGTFPSEIGKVEGLDVGDDVKRAILWENANRLYVLDRNPGT